MSWRNRSRRLGEHSHLHWGPNDAAAALDSLVLAVAARVRRRLDPIRDSRVLRMGNRYVRRPRGLLFAIPLIVGVWILNSLLPAQAFPFPDLIYEIEAVSGDHHASLLNLPIGQPGVPQAPMPVDVDGDLVPDVLVSVNLVNVAGLFNNPPDIGQVLAPNVVIDRALNGLPLDKPSPPLRINVKFTVRDVLGDGSVEPMVVRFGYDTGQGDLAAKGGSIPGSFKALLGGLDSFFNPLEAVISTRGNLVGLDSPLVPYEGPLTLIAGLEQGDFDMDAEMAYSPFPSSVRVTYGNDDEGDHITYDHALNPEPPDLPEIDVDTFLKVREGNDLLDVNARIERMPRSIALDLGSDPNGGSVDYRSSANERLPDVAVDVKNEKEGEPPLDAKLNIEALPRSMRGEWSVPPGGQMRAAFESTGQGIGAIEADIRNFRGDPEAVELFVPSERQFLNFQLADRDDGTPEQFISGRLERIRDAEVSTDTDGGFDGHIEVGDGERPLEVHALLNQASVDGPKIEATTKIAPLPDSIDVSFSPGVEGSEDEPLSLHYKASEAVDIDADAKVLLEDAVDAECGAAHTICAAVKARHIPDEITANVFNIAEGPGNDETRIEVEAEPREGGAKPDFFADATIGQDDGVPLVAHAEILGLAPFLSVRAVEGLDQTVEKAEFHACDRDWDDDVCRGPEGEEVEPDEIGQINFSLRNFIERPNDIRPPYAETPNFAAITARGRDDTTDVDFEAVGRILKIREVTFINKGVVGVRTNVGGGEDLSAVLDVKDVDLDGDDPANGRIDADAKAVVTPLPETFDFCFNQAGAPIVSAVHEITQPCQEDYPFDDLELTPMSFSYDASSDFDVHTDAAVTFQGPDPDDEADDRTFKGTLDVENIPAHVLAHVVTPDGDEPGPIHAKIDTDSSAGEQIDVNFAAEILDADLMCKDPRLPVGKDQALCVKGKLLNLPTNVEVFYDPTIKTDNLLVETEGDETMDFTDLEFSSVSRSDNETPEDPDDDKADILIATGQVLGLPKHVDGSLDMPADDEDAPSVEVNADPPLKTVDLIVRNFIAPDPVVLGMPEQRDGLEDPAHEVSYFQRGDSFKAEAHIGDVKGFGYRTVPDAGGKAADTKAIRVDFGTNQVIRAYADIQPDEESRTIADVTLEDVPAGISVCFRGEKEKGTPAEADKTFCDGANPDFPIDDDEGAIQFIGTPETPENSPLDVHAFVRHATGGGADILSGIVDITDIPFIIQGTYPSGDEGDLDIGGYALDDDENLIEDGINKIEAELASFDIKDDGYGSDRPFQQFTNETEPFPAPATSNQHASAVLKDEDFNAKVRLGTESQFQRIRMLDIPCEKPDDAPRNDYPEFPDDDVSKYTCIRADLLQDTTDPDQLDLYFVKQDGEDVIALRDAGITDIPAFVQMTIAETQTLEDTEEQGLRRPCGPEGDSDCMPPLLRFDQPANTNLFGMLQAGRTTDIAQLPDIHPREELANLDQLPASYAVDDEGVRAKIVSFEDDKGTTTESDDETRTAVQAGVNVPIPQSLTVDQMQKWSRRDLSGKVEYWDASDTKFRYVVRDSSGNPKATLGELSAMMHSVPDGNQLLVSAPCSVHPNDREDLSDCDADYGEGVVIPGEVGLGIYSRNHTGEGKDFIQVDGRLSATMNAGARILGGVAGFSVGRLEGEIKGIPANKNDTDPAFRLRVEMVGEGKSPPTGGGGGGGGEDEGSECTIWFCAKATAKVKNVFASFNFNPSGGADSAARLIEGVVNQGGATKQGLEIKSFNDPIDKSTPTPVHAEAAIEVDPINVFFHAGLPLIGGADFALLSELHAALDLNFNHFTLRHNLLHIKTKSVGGSSTLGPIDYYIYLMHGSAYGLFVKIFGIDFLPPSLPPPTGPPAGAVSLNFVDCEVGGLNILFPDFSNELEISGSDSDGRNVVMWPFLDPRIHFSGLLGGLVNFARVVAAPFFCLTDADSMELMTANHPGDPVGVDRVGEVHRVPDAPNPASPPTEPPPVVPTGTPPDLDVTSPLALCGTFTLDEVDVDSTLSVATSSNSTPLYAADPDEGIPEGPPRCASGSERTLTIVAREITVDGAITGNAIASHPDSAPTGNGGAGHRGAGGAGRVGGATNNGGGAYGDGSGNPVTETGDDNGAADGGGAITLHAQMVDNNGSITANGEDGADIPDNQDDCSVPDDEDTEDVDESEANSGTSGGGAGSGGGVVIVATSVDNDGVIQARGGAGGTGTNGGGGGGGGGAVKIISPILDAGSLSRAGGAGGTNFCTADSGNGGGGGNGTLVTDTRPQSRPEPIPDKFWVRDEAGAQLEVPFSAAAAGGDDTGFQVVLCGDHEPTSAISGAPDDTALNELFDMPTSGPSIAFPCGFSGFFNAVDPLGRVRFLNADNVEQVVYDPPDDITTIPVDEQDLATGYWGLWTVIYKSSVADNDCFDGDIFDAAVCTIEAQPVNPELVIGVDNTDPFAEITSPADPPAEFLTAVPQVTLGFEAFDQADLSGIATIECKNDSESFIECEQGGIDWPLSANDGEKSITVLVTDVAGNQFEEVVNGRLDTRPPNYPTVDIETPDGNNGWHQTPPDIVISGFDDPESDNPDDGQGSGPGAVPFKYQFDSGDEHDCAADPCDVDDSLTEALQTGNHEIHTTGVDAAGNRWFDDEDENTPSPMQSTPLKIDGEDPRSALLSVPESEDGANGWFATRPWVAISAIDQPGGSGLVNDEDDPVQNAGVFLSVDTTVNGTADETLEEYEGPFRLDNGTYEVCWFSRDVAGNVEDPTQCESFHVDDRKPSTATEATSPAASPDGDNGWYTEDVTVDVDTNDPTPGSGVVQGFDDDDQDELCGATAPEGNPDSPSGTCVSVDEEPFRPYFGEFTFSEGLHRVRTFAVDVAGHRSPIETALYMIDSSDPVASHRRLAAEPARAGWYRMNPRVILRAVDGDRNAGLRRIEYQVDGGGFDTYTEPFVIASGVHTVEYRAIDESGRASGVTRFTVKDDLAPPTVKARHPEPAIWLKSKLLGFLLGTKNARLHWTLGDDLSGDIKIKVIVYDALGNAIRHIDGGTRNVPPGTTINGFTEWDGKTVGLDFVSVGLYHFRVVAYDEAGNVAQSGESKPLQIKLSLL
ncbi:MAG: hypothetical protein WD646_00860 [Actinomycetota bacterium]